MRKSHDQVKYYLSAIKKLMVARFDMPVAEIQRHLNRNGLKLEMHYISRLRDRILRERTYRIDRYFLNYRLAEQDDARQEILTRAWDIVFNSINNREKLAAMQIILGEENNWTNLLVDLGVFNKGDDRAKRFIPVSEEKIAEMIVAFKAHLSPDVPEVKYMDAIVEEVKPQNQNDKYTTADSPSQPIDPSGYGQGVKKLADGSTIHVRFGLNRG